MVFKTAFYFRHPLRVKDYSLLGRYLSLFGLGSDRASHLLIFRIWRNNSLVAKMSLQVKGPPSCYVCV